MEAYLKLAIGLCRFADVEPSFLYQLLDTAGDLGRDPVPVNVPPRPGMAQEAQAICIGQRLPDLVRIGPDAVDRSAPADPRALAPQPRP